LHITLPTTYSEEEYLEKSTKLADKTMRRADLDKILVNFKKLMNEYGTEVSSTFRLKFPD
jgi:hypothetical protein